MIPVMSIQTWRWFLQPKIRRLIGFVSAVIGLVCYALSSSFNHLFGQWNLFKIFLYSCFSFIICLATLFAKVWQFTTSLLFKAVMAVLVLMATSVYSFFYDKAVTGKPDAYILISCVAFAIMFLSLSKQTRCGFQMDLSNFFLGCLIIQLMKINVLLAILGAALSYAIIIFRSSLDATPESEFSEDHLVVQVAFSQESNTNSATIQVESQLVEAIQMDSLQVNGATIIPQLEACIGELEKMEEIILLGLYKYVEKYIQDYNFPDIQVPFDDSLLIDSLPPETISSLQETINLMVAAGLEKECCDMYITCRKLFLQKSLLRLELSEFNSQEFLSDLIAKWMKAWYLALRLLFPSERRLCNQVFSGFSSVADLSFMEICRELISGLLNFPETLAIEKRSFYYLHSSLKLIQTLGDFIPEFESLFSSDHHNASLKNEASTTWKRLGVAIRVVFVESENQICRHMAQKPVPGGMTDPITHYVVNCFSDVLEGRHTLEKIFKECPMVGDKEGTFSSLSIQMARTMEVLESNLETKSKNYADPALSAVFMMNNWNYVVQKVTGSEMATILGDDWILKHTIKIQQNLEHYKRTWDMVLDLLKLDSNETVTPNAAARSMKKKLELFNKQFKEMCSVQSTWFVLDEQLREKIRLSIGQHILPTHENFAVRFQNLLGKDAGYAMLDIDALLDNLFRGNKIGNLLMGM
ncbi:hypothetical protein RIF29_17198 [Crotalaria pallida]|uniref:Exocyst subunit Exo70 family protein n=1 Tax=Crotalaria pallida TaxID=3830 RepID=A0AAN9FIU3_CROPI